MHRWIQHWRARRHVRALKDTRPCAICGLAPKIRLGKGQYGQYCLFLRRTYCTGGEPGCDGRSSQALHRRRQSLHLAATRLHRKRPAGVAHQSPGLVSAPLGHQGWCDCGDRFGCPPRARCGVASILATLPRDGCEGGSTEPSSLPTDTTIGPCTCWCVLTCRWTRRGSWSH